MIKIKNKKYHLFLEEFKRNDKFNEHLLNKPLSIFEEHIIPMTNRILQGIIN